MFLRSSEAFWNPDSEQGWETQQVRCQRLCTSHFLALIQKHSNPFCIRNRQKGNSPDRKKYNGVPYPVLCVCIAALRPENCSRKSSCSCGNVESSSSVTQQSADLQCYHSMSSIQKKANFSEKKRSTAERTWRSKFENNIVRAGLAGLLAHLKVTSSATRAVLLPGTLATRSQLTV